jgi:transcriptional regulator with XRE-family HTH domain
MSDRDKIKRRRMTLGLTDGQVAKAANLTVHQYADVEQHEHEFRTQLELREAKRICHVLGLSLGDLLEVPNASQEGLRALESLTRAEIVKTRREAVGLSIRQMSDELGFEESVLEKIESDPDFLESMPIDFVLTLSNLIKVPNQVLLGE